MEANNLFESYGAEVLKEAAYHLILVATFGSSMELRRYRDMVVFPAEEVANIVKIADDEARRLEEEAAKEGKYYMTHLVRIGIDEALYEYHVRMYRQELAAMVILSSMRGVLLPEPIQVLLA